MLQFAFSCTFFFHPFLCPELWTLPLTAVLCIIIFFFFFWPSLAFSMKVSKNVRNEARYCRILFNSFLHSWPSIYVCGVVDCLEYCFIMHFFWSWYDTCDNIIWNWYVARDVLVWPFSFSFFVDSVIRFFFFYIGDSNSWTLTRPLTAELLEISAKVR